MLCRASNGPTKQRGIGEYQEIDRKSTNQPLNLTDSWRETTPNRDSPALKAYIYGLYIVPGPDPLTTFQTTIGQLTRIRRRSRAMLGLYI